MEPGSNQPCSSSFPFYELHQVVNNTREISAPSAMDILCEIVNSEYSDVPYTMAPPIVGIPSHGAHHQHTEKESFLDILYSSGSKAMEIVNNDVEMIHHDKHPPYDIHFRQPPTLNSMAPSQTFSSPDMHQFKLPFLEQEPETSITNSQVDEKFKHKEIRRNLEKSILIQQEEAGQRQQPSLGSILSNHGEVKVHAERHEMSSCSNPMMLCDRYEYADSDMVDKVSSGSVRPFIDEGGNLVESDARGVDEARSNVASYLDEVKLSKRKSSARYVENSSYKRGSITRVKHGFSEKNTHTNGEENRVDVKEQSDGAMTKRLHMGGSGARVESVLATGGQKKPHIHSLLAGKSGQKRPRVESLRTGDDGPAVAVPGASEESGLGPRMTHISVERNRRKQMNEHLAILRSLMPTSYVQRSDQASVIGGVVEFIKELQQLLASLETQKRRRAYVAEALSPRVSAGSAGPSPRGSIVSQLSPRGATQELVATSRSPLADVEVKLAGGAHVLLRTLSHKATRGQLLHLIAALECMSLQILHLNITTLQQAVLYTFTLKIGIECRLSVDDLANVGQQIFKDIHARRL